MTYVTIPTSMLYACQILCSTMGGGGGQTNVEWSEIRIDRLQPAVMPHTHPLTDPLTHPLTHPPSHTSNHPYTHMPTTMCINSRFSSVQFRDF